MIGRAQLSEVEEHHGELDETASFLTVGEEKKMRHLIEEMEAAIDEKNLEKCRKSLDKLKGILGSTGDGKSA